MSSTRMAAILLFTLVMLNSPLAAYAHYAPQLGRFLQPDPAGYKDGPNLYTYVSNGPTAFGDPSGTQGDVLAGVRFRGIAVMPWEWRNEWGENAQTVFEFGQDMAGNKHPVCKCFGTCFQTWSFALKIWIQVGPAEEGSRMPDLESLMVEAVNTVRIILMFNWSVQVMTRSAAWEYENAEQCNEWCRDVAGTLKTLWDEEGDYVESKEPHLLPGAPYEPPSKRLAQEMEFLEKRHGKPAAATVEIDKILDLFDGLDVSFRSNYDYEGQGEGDKP